MAANKKKPVEVFPARHPAAELIDALIEAVILVDLHGRVVALNTAAEQLVGWPRDEAVGRRHDELLQLTDAQGQVPDSPVLRCLRERRVIQLDGWQDHELTARDGRRMSVRLRCSPVSGSGGDGVLVAIQDQSQQSLLAKELAYRMDHDPVTGLLNREAMDRRIAEALTQARHQHARHLFCHLDIDQFRVINETLGHGAGNEFLRELAGHLRARLLPGDALARLGGDEFGVLLQNCTRATGAVRVEMLLTAVRNLRFTWGRRKHASTVSMGVLELDEQTAGVADVLSLAEASCLAAKSAGHDRAHYATGGEELKRRKSEMGMVTRIRQALEQNEFELHSEEVVRVDAPDTVVYRELLVRMRDRNGVLTHPDAFIPVAERYSMIGALDRWIIGAAIAEIARRRDDGVVYAINLSGMSLGDDQLLGFVEESLATSGAEPRRICFEITETATISRLAEAVRLIERLRDLGCSFALDDFGAGMASFAYLRSLPVDFLKIDGSFVSGMLKNRLNRGMVEAINRVGHDMGLKTIAEHVEDKTLLKLLREIGVDYAQGRAIAATQLFGPRAKGV